MAGDETNASGPEMIMPRKAYLVLTRESWGCLEGQEIVADVTRELAAAEGKPLLLTEVKNPEDVDNRMELYLYFPIHKIEGVAGYFVLRLGVIGPRAQIAGTLRLAEAVLVRNGRRIGFRLKAKSKGQLKSDLLYAGDARLASGLFTCPSADLFEARKVKFLGVYPIQTEIDSIATKIDSKWDRVTIQLEERLHQDAEAVAACYGLLTAMEKEFSASGEHFFLWDESLVASSRIGLIASSLERDRKLRFHVNIELRGPQGKTEIPRDPRPFVPQLRQMISARNAQGKITGGIATIAVEKSGKI